MVTMTTQKQKQKSNKILIVVHLGMIGSIYIMSFGYTCNCQFKKSKRLIDIDICKYQSVQGIVSRHVLFPSSETHLVDTCTLPIQLR